MESLFLVCVPESWDHVSDSTLDQCTMCGQSVWVSPSGREGAVLAAEGAPVQVICVECAAEQTDVEVLPPTKGQIEALREEKRRRAEKN
jgi:hypothetical protein